jgi:bifunctional UDP-N-acetylglucosamine pyrophosphorylase/glucosamine-1-phosphate N-acetyltransferase
MSTRVVILAAGKGTRMGADLPKSLVEIAGRPMIEHLIESIHESEIDSRPILVVAPDTVEQFNEVCQDQSCEYAVQDEQLGTGHATQAARENANGAENIMVLLGDHPFLSAELMQSLVDLHAEQDAVVSMVTTKVKNFKKDFEIFKSWGRIIRDDVGRIVEIKEAKDATEEELEVTEVNPSLYLFKAEWLWEHLPEIKNKNASGEYYLTDLIAMAIEEENDVVTVAAEPFEVIGINTKEELERAEAILG